LKLFQEWGQGEIKENGGGGELKYDVFAKTFYKCQHNNKTDKQKKN
jgi:hypothetical protein